MYMLRNAFWWGQVRRLEEKYSATEMNEGEVNEEQDRE